jgi:hypothetical protein
MLTLIYINTKLQLLSILFGLKRLKLVKTIDFATLASQGAQDGSAWRIGVFGPWPALAGETPNAFEIGIEVFIRTSIYYQISENLQ